MAKLKELIAQHQMGAAATAGGLGAVVLGTKTGRSAAMGAAKLGALALIGGLAYKAYQNYSAGQAADHRCRRLPARAGAVRLRLRAAGDQQ